MGAIKRKVSTPNPVSHCSGLGTNSGSLQAGDPTPKSTAGNASTTSKADQTGAGIGAYALIVIGGLVAYASYQYMQSSQES